VANFLLGVDALEAVGADVEVLKARRSAVRAIAGRWITHPRVWVSAGEHHVVRRYFLEAETARGAARIVEKSTRNVRWVPHLGIAFPKARFIFLMRHPLDALSSWWRRANVDPTYSHWGNISADDFCDHWEGAVARADDLTRTDPRLLVVRYEDLTDRAEETMKRILAHVGEPFDDACLLRDTRGDIPDPMRGVARVEALRTADPLVFTAIGKNDKRWSDYVDNETAARVERRLARAMSRVGYSPMTAAPSEQPRS
jgi:hypothetical protein